MPKISEAEEDAVSVILTEEEKTEMKNKCFAAIDLGTNSCRLLIADDKGRYLYNDAVATKLGEGMSAQNRITPEAAERALARPGRDELLLSLALIATLAFFSTSAATPALRSNPPKNESPTPQL